MRAHQIMATQVVTVGADSPIAEAVDTMLRYHVSGLPVVDAAGHLVGIVSEGDFLRRAEIGTERKRGRWLQFFAGTKQAAADFVHEHGRKVSDVMTRDPVTITEDTSLDAVAVTMESHKIKRLPVMRGERLVGIVTHADFLPAIARLARNDPTANIADDRIRGEILAEIGQAAWRPCKLKVTVSDGVATLSGVVNGPNARRAAIVAAENVPGTREVRDDLIDATERSPDEDSCGDFVSLQDEPSTTDDKPL